MPELHQVLKILDPKIYMKMKPRHNLYGADAGRRSAKQSLTPPLMRRKLQRMRVVLPRRRRLRPARGRKRRATWRQPLFTTGARCPSHEVSPSPWAHSSDWFRHRPFVPLVSNGYEWSFPILAWSY